MATQLLVQRCIQAPNFALTYLILCCALGETMYRIDLYSLDLASCLWIRSQPFEHDEKRWPHRHADADAELFVTPDKPAYDDGDAMVVDVRRVVLRPVTIYGTLNGSAHTDTFVTDQL
jgi:hypothetical protein